MSRTLVIAEPGCTAEGELDTQIMLAIAAAKAGASIFKSQWTSNARRMVERRNAPDYLRFYRWLQHPVEWHETLARVCAEHRMDYACSVYLPEDVAAVAPYVEYLKVSSFEAKDKALLAAADRSGCQVIVSAGMCDEDEIDELVDGERCVLACTSAYPAPLATIRLGMIRRHELDGLSDHSRNIRMGAYAYCAGAHVIEAHIRLNVTDPANPDYATAFSPEEFVDYVAHIREAETASTDYVGIPEAERPMMRYRVGA